MTKVDEVLDTISSMTVLELSELLKEFEEKFGVTAAAPVAAAAPAGADAGADEAESAGSATVDLILTDVGSEKIKVIKEVRGFSSMGLKEAKDLVEGVPASLMSGVAAEEAQKAKEALEAVGAKVEIK